MSPSESCCGGTDCCAAARPPAPTEAGAPYAATAALPWPAILDRYGLGVENFDRRVFELSDDQLDTAFAPDAGVGNWPVRVLLGHLADAELSYTFRIRKAAAENGSTIEGWDENAWVDAGLYSREGHPSVGAAVAVIHTLRQWGSDWLPALSEAQRAHRVIHPTRGALSVRDMVACLTWHLEHHAAYLNRKVEKFLGAPTPVRGGCGPACGCHAR